jgi:signal transduction histidine kinase
MGGLGLRARLVAGFVGIAALTTLVSALLTARGLDTSFEAYLERRTADATASAVTLAEEAHAASGGWTPAALDRLSHELVLTGYDFRLVEARRTLLDTTKLESRNVRRIAQVPVRSATGAPVATLELFALGPRGDTPADEELREGVDRAHLLAAAIAALVAIAAGLVVAGRLASPLRRLALAARRMGVGGAAPDAIPPGSSEVRELGEALTALAEDLGRQRRSRRQLAQDLSHELRTPLMLLQGRIEGMQDGVVPFDAEGLAALHAETLRLSRLIAQIEHLAEAEAQPMPIRREPIALDELAVEARGTLAAAFEARGLELQLQADPAPAWADRDAARQVAANLLTNALKYAPSQHPVVLSTALEGVWAVLRVADGGSGISDAEAERLFERFYRGVGAAEQNDGAGLGLTIARKLAEAQGGKLQLETHGAEGTRFTLRLPARISADVGPLREAGAQAPTGRDRG